MLYVDVRDVTGASWRKGDDNRWDGPERKKSCLPAGKLDVGGTRNATWNAQFSDNSSLIVILVVFLRVHAKRMSRVEMTYNFVSHYLADLWDQDGGSESFFFERRRTQSLHLDLRDQQDKLTRSCQHWQRLSGQKPLQMIPVHSAQKLQRNMQFGVQILRVHSMERSHVPIHAANWRNLLVCNLSSYCKEFTHIPGGWIFMHTSTHLVEKYQHSVTALSIRLMIVF